MKNEFVKILAVTVAMFLIACGDDGTGTTPGDDGQGDSTSSSTTRVDRASLEAAVPANGAIVRGDFFLGAIVDAADPVEVRFLIDGTEVGVVNELPYQLSMNSCDLTVGNHAYVVQIEDAQGGTDYLEMFFEANCD